MLKVEDDGDVGLERAKSEKSTLGGMAGAEAADGKVPCGPLGYFYTLCGRSSVKTKKEVRPRTVLQQHAACIVPQQHTASCVLRKAPLAPHPQQLEEDALPSHVCKLQSLPHCNRVSACDRGTWWQRPCWLA